MIRQLDFWVIFGGLWFGVGSLFVVVGGIVLWHEASTEARLAREGVAASGVVLSKRMTGSKDDPKFTIEYRFNSGSGVNESSTEVDGALWDRLLEGEAVALRYVPAAPDVHRIAGEQRSRWLRGILFAGVGSLFALTGGLILWRRAARRRFVAELLRDGMRAEGEVLEVAPTRLRVNRVPLWAIRYRYRDADGNPHEARTPPMAEEEATRWQPGERGEVRYERARPHRSLWGGRS